MTTTPVFPSATNTFVPSHEATGKMVVDFARNPNKFSVNEYCQIVPVDSMQGVYLQMTIEESARVMETDASELLWADSNDAPTGADGTESHLFKPYFCRRYAPSARIGNQTVQNASWDIIDGHASIKSRQAMTVRTQLAINTATNSGNYGSHTSDVGSISGITGNMAASTTARQTIKRALNYAATQILLDTNSGIELEDLVFVINPNLAAALSECQEIVDHIKGSPDAKAQVMGTMTERSKNAIFGLPDKLYGFSVVVERTVKVTSRKGATRSASFVLPDATPFLCARPGSLIGIAGAPSFSTITVFSYKPEEMLVEVKNDDDNKRQKVRVIDTFDVQMTAPVSGFLFTSAM